MAHGASASEQASGPSSIQSVKTAVIALMGTAPIGPVNVLTESKSAVTDAQFGLQVPGFTIPQALAAIRANEPNAIVHIVNVADAGYGTRQALRPVVNETLVLVGGAGTLAFAPETSPAPVVKDSTLATTYVSGTDYTISANGAFARVGTAIGATDTLKISYSRLGNLTFVADKATLPSVPYRSAGPIVYNVLKTTTYVSGTDYTINAYGVVQRIVGGNMAAGQMFLIDYEVFDGIVLSDLQGTASPRTGSYLYGESYSTYGYRPTIWLASYYTQVSGVAGLLAGLAANYGGIYFIDEVEATSVATVVTHRGAGSGAKFDISDERCIACYPMVNVVAPHDNELELRPLSMYLAGYMAMIDRTAGPQRSMSNFTPQAILGFESTELTLTWDPDHSQTTDLSQLDDVEVVSVKPGKRAWGNRSTAYRDSAAVTTFYSVRRVVDILKRSIIEGSIQFFDSPINKLLIDSILQAGNAYFATEVAKGTVLKATLTYNPADNSDAEIALGHLVFGATIIPSIPAEQIDYQFFITTEGISDLLAG